MAKTRPLPTLPSADETTQVINDQAELPPARKPMSCGDVDDLAEKLILNHEAADRILMQVAKGEELSGAGVTLLRSVGLENPHEIDGHVCRLRSIVRFQEQAGTAAERQALIDELRQAEERRERELPAIRQELEAVVARLQAQTEALESAVAMPSGKLAVMAAAVEHLKTVRNLPQFVLDRYNVLRGRTKALFRELYDAESVVLNRTGVLALLAKAEPFLGTSNQITHSSEVAVFLSRVGLWADILDRTIDKSKFLAFKATTENELKAAQKIIERDAPERAGRLAEIESARDYYVPQ